MLDPSPESRSTAISSFDRDRAENSDHQPYRWPKQSPMVSLLALLAALVVGVLAPVLLFAGYVVAEYTFRERARSVERASEYAAQVASGIERQVRTVKAALAALASSPALAQGNLATFHQQAVSVAELTGFQVVVRDLDGQHIVNTRVPWGTPLPKRYQPAIDDRLKDDETAFVTDLFQGSLAGANIVAIVMPAKVDGRLKYSVMTSIDPERLSELLTDQTLPEPWTTSIADRSGRIIARSKDLAQFVGQVSNWYDHSDGVRGVARLVGLGGGEYLRAYEHIDSGWIVSAFVPADAVEAPLRRAWLLFFASGSGSLLVAMGLAWLVASRILQPMAKVAVAAQALGRGETVSPVASPIGEIALVSEAISDASIRLRARTRDILESETRYRALFEQAAVGFEHISLTGKWLGVNARLRAMLGYDAAEFSGMSRADITMPEHRANEQALTARLLRQDVPSYVTEKQYRRKDGKWMWVRETASLALETTGEPAYIIAVIEDVTQRRSARIAAARLAALVQSSQDAILSVSPSGIVESWNPGARTLFGYDYLEVIGQPYAILLPERERGSVDDMLVRILAGQSSREETVVTRKDGTPINVAVSTAPVRGKDDAIVAASVMMEDISERKSWEHEVALLNRELQHRVKNSLAVIQSIVNQTLKDSTSSEAFRASFEGRLQSLAAANDLLTCANKAGGTELGPLIERQLAPLVASRDRQLQLTGPALTLHRSMTTPLGLCIHELGTNALKYGAWTTDHGRVDITWQVQPDPTTTGRDTLVFDWHESGGPPVAPPQRRGFGSALIERGIPGAQVTRRFERDGLICRICIHLPAAEPTN